MDRSPRRVPRRAFSMERAAPVRRARPGRERRLRVGVFSALTALCADLNDLFRGPRRRGGAGCSGLCVGQRSNRSVRGAPKGPVGARAEVQSGSGLAS